MVVVQQGGLAVLEVGDGLAHAALGQAAHPGGQGVDEQADHLVGAGQVGGAAVDGGAEHHVLLSGQLGEQDRPRALQEGVEGDAELGGAAGQFASLVDRQGYLDAAQGRGRALEGGVGGDQGRLVEALQFALPACGGGLLVLRGQPGQVVAVAAGRGEVLGAGVQADEVGDHHR